MKKLFTLLCLFLLTANAAWALNTNKNLLQEGTDLSAYDNVIYVAPQTVTASEAETTITLSICMKNTAPIRGFEFDMYLPEVISVKKNNKGRIQGVSLNVGRLPEDDDHMLTLSELSDGAVHFVCGSMYDDTFTGNDGEIMTMEVNLLANVAVGDYPIQLKNMKLSETDITNYYEVSAVETMLTIADNNLEVYTEFDEATGTLTYYYDSQMASRPGITELYTPEDHDAVRFKDYYGKVLKTVIDPSMKNAHLTSTYSMFFGGISQDPFGIYALENMTEIDGLENLNTSAVTDMESMFFGCYSLTMLDLSSFNTSSATNLNGMFFACSKLVLVDISSFDISNVTDMRMMFGGCSKLRTICCFEDWSTTSAQSSNMFISCSSLVGGNGTAFDSNVIDATYARPDGGTASPGYFTEDTMTGIESIHNSQFTIHNEEAIYNLAGQRLSKTQRGINIVGGKKIIRE